jgi:hypothetical protein
MVHLGDFATSLGICAGDASAAGDLTGDLTGELR